MGEDVAEGGFAKTGGTIQQHVVQGVAALAGSVHEDLHLVAQPFLADHLLQRAGTEGVIDLLIAWLHLAGDAPVGLALRAFGYALGSRAWVRTRVRTGFNKVFALIGRTPGVAAFVSHSRCSSFICSSVL